MAGMFAGVMATGLGFASLRGFYESHSRGPLTIPDVLHVPYGAVVLAIVVLALAGFWIAERIERRSA